MFTLAAVRREAPVVAAWCPACIAVSGVPPREVTPDNVPVSDGPDVIGVTVNPDDVTVGIVLLRVVVDGVLPVRDVTIVEPIMVALGPVEVLVPAAALFMRLDNVVVVVVAFVVAPVPLAAAAAAAAARLAYEAKVDVGPVVAPPADKYDVEEVVLPALYTSVAPDEDDEDDDEEEQDDEEGTVVPNAVAGLTPVTLPIRDGVVEEVEEVSDGAATPDTVPTRLGPTPAVAWCRLCTAYPPPGPTLTPTATPPGPDDAAVR